MTADLERELNAARGCVGGLRRERDELRAALASEVERRERAERERDEARKDLDAVGHALGVCYDHDHGCGGAGPVEELVRAAKDGCAARGVAMDEGARAEAAEASLSALRDAAERATSAWIEWKRHRDCECPGLMNGDPCPGGDECNGDDVWDDLEAAFDALEARRALAPDAHREGEP